MKLNFPTRKLITGLMVVGLVTATFIAPVRAGPI